MQPRTLTVPLLMPVFLSSPLDFVSGAFARSNSIAWHLTRSFTMRPYHYLTITALPALTSAQGKCRFGNGTLLPDIAEWNIYQPCPGTDGSTTICCAIGRSNPPWGNISQGYTQDDCLPNGLCQNRLTETDGSKKTTWV